MISIPAEAAYFQATIAAGLFDFRVILNLNQDLQMKTSGNVRGFRIRSGMTRNGF
jgi:hypothetical protein